MPGETTTPAIRSGDLLIAVSGSGETDTVALMVKKAKAHGAETALLTMVPDSTMGGLADLGLHLRASFIFRAVSSGASAPAKALPAIIIAGFKAA